MALASSSTASIAYAEEITAYGEIEDVTPNALRMTGEDLKFDIQSESTKEINSTRQVADNIIVGAESGGGVNFELSYREYDAFLESIMTGSFNTFGTNGVNALTVSFVKAAGTITDDGVDGFTGLVVGQWFSISGSASNNGVYRVKLNDNDVITVDASTPLLADEASIAVNVSSTRLTMAANSTLRSFSLQKYFADVGQTFMFTGMAPSSMSFDFNTASIVTGNVGFLGKGSTRKNGNTYALATQFIDTNIPTASHSYGVVNSVTGVGVAGGGIILRDYQSADLVSNTFVQSMKLSIEANLRGQKAIGVLGNAGVAFGTYGISGTIEVYLSDGAIYDEALANRSVQLTFPTKDVNNNGYGFTLNNCKLGVPSITAGGMDTDVMMSIPFTAIAPDTTNDRMLIVDRFGAAIA